MNWQRATTDEKKSERKIAIYEATLTLFKQKGYDKVSFNGIASQAGFTKSNMYRYFSSKEEIFLSIFADLFQSWFEDIFATLKSQPQNIEAADFAKQWTKSYAAHQQFLDLTPILFTSLESNSAYEQLLDFKTLSLDLLYQLAVEISRIYPALQGEKPFQFLTLSFAATANYWAAQTQQNEALEKIYQLDQFQALKPNFEKSLSDSITIIIKGLKAD